MLLTIPGQQGLGCLSLSLATVLSALRVLGDNIFAVGVQRLPFSGLQHKTKVHTSQLCCAGTVGHSIVGTVVTVQQKRFSQK